MSIDIAKSTGIFKFGRLALAGVVGSLFVCYSKVIIVSLLILLGAPNTVELSFSSHSQAVGMMLFATLGMWGLARDRQVHHDARPFILGLGLLVFLFVIIYTDFFPEESYRKHETWTYISMVVVVFWNQHLGLKSLAAQLSERSAEVEQKNAELEQISQMKSRFLASMSHELRTPLNAIIGFSEVLDARMFGELNEKQSEYVKDIHESGHHLLALVNDILDLSKIEAGRMELELSRFNLPQVLESAVLMVQERAARHGLTVDLDIDEGLGNVYGDERRIKQVLLNLLSNAVKFTPDGGRIEVTAKPVNDTLQIAVRDTGVGIAKEVQTAIFEEFRQVQLDQVRKQEGTGLGLALAKKFVELHRGTLGVESAPGQGSTFTVTLPLAA